ncbi:hypothetical protein [Clostridium beijerinckii]|uniref:Uncharacterized protein n=1 Tax=Clostridium beijerinckii TaxID=1520 RepID=A0A1S8RH52_CLOBE|nr:hypothetical protein [Clostridium beijerinckii]NRY59016.1 ribosomal protein S16 [Clostridium beijerinckii]OOM52395.1 hypothetical protein CLBCK_48980 [Clostridium beijerinckii]
MTKVNKLPTKKLWNPKSFIIFSVFFSFLPAGIMCALNYGRSGSQKKKWIFLLTSILVFIALITLLPILSINTSIIFFGINIALGIILMFTQLKLYNEHIQNGGQSASYLLPVIIGLLIFSLSAASILYSIYVPKNALDYAENHLFYTNKITESQAKKLGDYLNSGGYFTPSSKVDVKIDKQDTLYILSLVVEGDYKSDTSYVEPMKAISRELSKNVFENNKVRIDLCNDRFQVLNSINVD